MIKFLSRKVGINQEGILTIDGIDSVCRFHPTGNCGHKCQFFEISFISDPATIHARFECVGHGLIVTDYNYRRDK